MKRFLSVVAAAAVGLGGAALSQGCFLFGGDCGAFTKDLPKYEFEKLDETKESREIGPFVIAVYGKGLSTEESKNADGIRQSVEAALKECGGGSVEDFKDEGGVYRNFGRWGPYVEGVLVPLAFETKFRSKDVNTAEPLELVWKGDGRGRALELNKLEGGKPAQGYPTLVEVGDKFILKCPLVYAGDKEKTLISASGLEERPSGGYRFKQLPFSVRSKAKNAEAAIEWANGADDLITPTLEPIYFYAIRNLKVDPRELMCRLLSKQRESAIGPVEFKLLVSTLWFRAESAGGRVFKIYSFEGYKTATGEITSIEPKLPEGYPSPGKKFESYEALRTAAEKQDGDYFMEKKSDLSAGRVTWGFHIRVAVKKGQTDPEKCDFKLQVKDPAGKTQDFSETVNLGGGK